MVEGDVGVEAVREAGDFRPVLVGHPVVETVEVFLQKAAGVFLEASAVPEDMNSIPWLDWTARGCRCAAGFWPSLPTD